MCVQQSQLVSMMAFANQVHKWRQRGAYATLRPAGWRSQPESKTSPSESHQHEMFSMQYQEWSLTLALALIR